MDNKETFFGGVLKKYKDRFNYKILVILLIAVLSRSILLGQYPGEFMQMKHLPDMKHILWLITG